MKLFTKKIFKIFPSENITMYYGGGGGLRERKNNITFVLRGGAKIRKCRIT